jgi:hypothetical protein
MPYQVYRSREAGREMGGMDKVTPLKDRALKPATALRRIQQIWNDGKVTWQPQADIRARTLGLSNGDVANVIRKGAVTGHRRSGEFWAYTIEGQDLDERALTIVVEVAGYLTIIRVITHDRITEE